MKKDLPNVFVNPFDKNLNNAQEVFYSEDNKIERSSSGESVITKINRIFNSSHHVYKSRVKITTSNEVLEKDIVGRTNGNLLTIDGESIKIIDILDIEKI